MNKARLALRLILTTSMSNRQIATAVGIAYNTVRKYRKLIRSTEFNWPSIEAMDDNDIEQLIKTRRQYIYKKRIPDWEYVRREMQLKDVTLILLWEEYRIVDPTNAYSYSQFTCHYREYVNKLDLSMRQTHRAGEVGFVDFAGRRIPYTDPNTGEEVYTQVFIGVLGCSNYTFVLAVKSQSLLDWIAAHKEMFRFFGGVPQIVVPDNLKAAVTKAGSDPTLNRTYLELAKHYGIVIVPARVRRPKDKSKAEIGVQLASRWIMAKLRHRKFFSLAEINEAIAVELTLLNERPFKKLPDCRLTRFVELDKPMLKPLPKEPFEFAEWTSLQKVGPDYHIRVRDHYYSVPYSLVGMSVEARITHKTIEIFHRGRQVATHIRSHEKGAHTTLRNHQPKAHQAYADQTPQRLLNWAKSIGESTYAVVQHHFDSRPHHILAIKACGTLQRLSKEYGHERLEGACQRAQSIGSMTVKSIRSILQRKLTKMDEEQLPIQTSLPFHQNVRGPHYYTDTERSK